MPELEEILVSVWRQALVDGAKYVQIDGEKYPIRETARRRLKQVDFRFEDKNSVDSNRTLIRSRDGQKWLEKERK